MKQKTHNERPPVPFEEMDAEWVRHIRCVNRWVDEYREPEGEEVSRLSRWYAERQEMRRVASDRARLAAATVCVAVVACVTLTVFAPRPDPEAIDAASQPDRAAVCVLADNMLTRL